MTELTDSDVELMLQIAKENLLNPLYEQVVREFEEAQVRMMHARIKLALAVKLTDNEILNERLGPSPEEVSRQQYYKVMLQQKMIAAQAGK